MTSPLCHHLSAVTVPLLWQWYSLISTALASILKSWHGGVMRRRNSDEDFATNALRVVEQSIGGKLAQSAEPIKSVRAVAAGRRGGLKGGNARAASMTPDRRSQIAKKAASKRWSK
jgi:hypothetical protein